MQVQQFSLVEGKVSHQMDHSHLVEGEWVTEKQTFTRKHLEFWIEDKPLKSLLCFEGLEVKLEQGVTLLRWFGKDSTRQALRVLKGREMGLAGGRIELYVCHLCGDLGCGTFTAEMQITYEQVIWKNFAYQTAEDHLLPMNRKLELHFSTNVYFGAFQRRGF